MSPPESNPRAPLSSGPNSAALATLGRGRGARSPQPSSRQ